MRNITFYERYIKRFLDIVLSLIAIILLSPVLLILAIMVSIKLGSPVIFRQIRPGYNEKLFTMMKFRSMTNATDEKGTPLPDEERLTSFGAKLRDTSLDELPELFNILKGDMSIVGPRPQLVRDMVFMTKDQRRRHQVRPGLTGLAQVNGRNAISWETKLQYDLDYIKKVTLLGDVKILVKTISRVFTHEDISAEGMATAEDLGDFLFRTGRVTPEEYERLQTDAKSLIDNTIN